MNVSPRAPASKATETLKRGKNASGFLESASELTAMIINNMSFESVLKLLKRVPLPKG